MTTSVAQGSGGWGDLASGAPEIARLGSARLDAARLALLGTVRRDGSPRISPVEPYLVDDQLLVGLLAWSRKADDLRRDPRCALHTTVTGPDAGEGELKLFGSAVEVGAGLRARADGAWWIAAPPERAFVCSLRIAHAVFVEWDLQHGEMTVHRWSPAAGYRRRTRRYP